MFAHTTILAIKVQTLICFHALLKVLDKVFEIYLRALRKKYATNKKFYIQKFTMTEKLIPLLKNIKTKEPTVVVNNLYSLGMALVPVTFGQKGNTF